MEFGVAASMRQGDNFKRLKRFLVDFEVLPFDRDATKPYGPLRKALQTQGTPIGPLYFLIATHALSLKATLVTNNTGVPASLCAFPTLLWRIGQRRLESFLAIFPFDKSIKHLSVPQTTK
ncbi:MAG: hypothetical protein PHD43_01660 [Methylococcales bacterium]|nr:hypothetical protein [Methylococcales bacterium]